MTALSKLDSPEWAALTSPQKRLVSNVYGNDTGEGWSIQLTGAMVRIAKALEDKGLITVKWGEGNNKALTPATLRIREEGWTT